MKQTNRQALVEHLAALGVESGRNVVVHSSLPAFGILGGGPAALHESLRDLIGADATIAVPTYRLTAPADEIFNRASSPSLSVGTFSEFLRKLPGAARSSNPLHSHAFVGPLAQYFFNDLPRPSFGPNSDFDFFVEHDFLCLMLGCNLENAGTFVFHSQACANTIPYRSWRNLSRLCVFTPDETPRSFEFAYYARNSGAPRESRRETERRIAKAGLLRSVPAAYGNSRSFNCEPANRFLVQLFQSEPTICIPVQGAQ